jgi:probable F420-dependent oxidoreductase
VTTSKSLPILLGLPPGDMAGGSPTVVVDTARRAEEAGFAGVVISDHVVMGARTDRYPWGSFKQAPDCPWPEPLTVLTAVAAVTTTLRLCTGILIAPLRPATLLAKTAATLDVLSQGRLELGVGTGWQQEEFDAQGLDAAARGQLLTDTIGACRALWGASPATFSSASVSFADIWCHPRPVSPGGPPVLFSGTLTPRNVRRIVELGDGWIPIMGERPPGVTDGVAVLTKALADAGRDPAALRVRAHLPVIRADSGDPDLAASLAGVPELVAGGATDVVTPLGAFVRDEADLPAWFAQARRSLQEHEASPA